MTRIDFYIINSQQTSAEHAFACQLAEMAYCQKNQTYIHTRHETQSHNMDEMLWTFKETSFIPHNLATATTISTPSTLIGFHSETMAIPENHHDVLINLCHKTPSFFSQFKRVAEIISNNETSKTAGRERYRFYRDRGYPLETHQLSL